MREADFTPTRPADWADFTGSDFRSCFVDRFPEFAGLIDADGVEVGHDNMHHRETLLEHQVMVIDAAQVLASAVGLTTERRGLLVMAALWHDIGKPLTRAPKERWVCVGCTKPHHDRPNEGKCRRCGCTTLPRTLYGYFGHAEVGARAWWEVAARERMDSGLSCTLYNLIRWHSHVHDLVETRRFQRLGRIEVLLSWADSRGRIHSHFDDEIERDEESFQLAWEHVSRGRG